MSGSRCHQEGSLCAQHCLNALLQGSYFTPVDLAILAQQMDDEERLRMAESGVDSEDYRRFLEFQVNWRCSRCSIIDGIYLRELHKSLGNRGVFKADSCWTWQPSGNYDDSGYFSVQVISSALEVWGLELVPYNSTEPRALEAQQCPEAMQAFICNYRDHWFTIRRLGQQWFNLNSLLTGPELISDTYLAMFLAQLQQEGYSIFVVFGSFPECEADTLLRLVPAVQTVKPRPLAPVKSQTLTSLASSHNQSSEEDLQRALRLSLGPQEDQDAGPSQSKDSQDDLDLQRALRLSLKGNEQGPSSSNSLDSNKDDEEELQKALRLSLQGASPGADQEDLELEKALKMSLECCEPCMSSSQDGPEINCSNSCARSSSIAARSTSNHIDAEDVRRKRLAYLEANAQRNTPPTAQSSNSQVNT
ncbi:ataxin-3-like isoform X2 [Periplaneta americana]|uniref:ataxin-3-like isoform X2 n=1 Tax=Periplaneta americana TaxID=6978 RepID=UPI0037E7936A